MASDQQAQPSTAYDPDSESDFSDVDQEEESGIYLGLPDGPLEGEDESNPLVSRLGGLPAWLPFSSSTSFFHTSSEEASTSAQKLPLPPSPAQVSQCKICGKEMEMLVQIFAPLEGSCFDRTINVWGCARAGCQKRRDSRCVRAFRTVTFNARWAAKLAKEKAKEEARTARIAAKAKAAKAALEEKEKMSKVNPFSTSSASSAAGGMFGGNPFASPVPQTSTTDDSTTSAHQMEKEGHSDSEDSEDDDEFRLAEEMAIKASLHERQQQQQDEPWKQRAKRPHYKAPYYINTIPEPSSSSATVDSKKASEKATITELGPDDDSMGPGGKSLSKEGYEKMFVSGLDPIFERFLDRVARSSSQLIRYEFGGEPIPFSNKGETYKKLWKRKQTSTVPVEQFNDDAPGACAVCGSRRVFEMQLMPNVVNMLRPEKIQDGETDKEQATSKTNGAAVEDRENRRKREIERALGRSVADPKMASDLATNGIHRSSDYASTAQGSDAAQEPLLKTGLTWSTVMVFVCENDCVGPKDAANDSREACVEELVEITWEE